MRASPFTSMIHSMPVRCIKCPVVFGRNRGGVRIAATYLTTNARPATRLALRPGHGVNHGSTWLASSNPMGVEWFGLAMAWVCPVIRLLCTDFLWCSGRWRRNPCRQTPDAADCGSSQDAISIPGDPAGMIAIALTYKSEVAIQLRKTRRHFDTTWRSR